ncbi:MAG: hypothetical protein Q8M83_00885 [bacterium]|nr:hypothetical protein [bacterium]
MDFITVSVINEMYRHSQSVVATRSQRSQERNKKFYLQIQVAAMVEITGCPEAIATTEIKKGLWFPEQTRIYVRDSQLMPIMQEWDAWLKSLDQPKWWQRLFSRRKKPKGVQSD